MIVKLCVGMHVLPTQKLGVGMHVLPTQKLSAAISQGPWSGIRLLMSVSSSEIFL